MAGSWATLTNAPPAAVATTLLLTNGAVLAQGVSTNSWYRLTPDGNGDYGNGTWTNAASSVEAPLYYASGVLRDGHVIVAGGEYDAGAAVWLLNVERYDPISNSWTTLPNPPGWVRIGDAPGCVLPDGRFFLGQVGTRNTAIYDPATNTWTAAANKINSVGEDSWSLLPDGTVLAVDCSNPPNAEKYIIAADTWVSAGATLDTLVDSISEIGASVLLNDGRVFVIGATGFTAIYTAPPIANQPGTWERGPTIPQVNPGQPLGAVDGPAAVLPNGRVLFTAGPITTPATFQTPTFFFEYDPDTNAISQVPSAARAAAVPYCGRMLVLPTGQILYTSHHATVELYTPDDAPDPVWRPTITGCPGTIRRGRAFTLEGRQINGLNQGSYYGNDATQATNYPIVRLESATSDAVYYCGTSNFSTMGLQTGTVVHSCDVYVPAGVPIGPYCLRVIANGIASACETVSVANKWFKELKFEIKDKLEVLENLKAIADISEKRVPDIVDVKGIRENIDFVQLEEEWTKTIRAIAASVDHTNQQLGRSFIQPHERPFVGRPEPEIEELRVPKVSAAEARRFQEKRAFPDDVDQEAVFTKQALEVRDFIHALSRSGGKAELRERVTKATATKATAKKTTAKKTTAKKTTAKKTTAKKTGGRRARPQ